MSGAVLITGVAGFIGSHAAEAFLRAGRRVVGVDNFDPFYDVGWKRANLTEVERAAASAAAPSPVAARHPLPRRGEGLERAAASAAAPSPVAARHPLPRRGEGLERAASDRSATAARGRFEFEECDIRDGVGLRRLFERVRPETVVHLAAKAGVRPSIASPALYAQVNVEGTVNVFEAARASGCPRVLMASSSSVYGNAQRVPFSEEDEALEPISPYAATKRACELLAHTYHHLHGLRIACLRFFTAYGARQRPDLAIMNFMRKMMRGEAITVFGDGGMSRDFTHIDDIVAGVAASERAIDAHGVRTWNLGSDHPVRVRELVEAIARATGIEARVERREKQAGDVERTWADLTRSRAELGYAPSVGLDEGLRRQWAWAVAREAAAASASASA